MEGTLVTGQGAGASFVAATADTLAAEVGFRPYPGTINLDGVGRIEGLPLQTLEDDLGDPHCEGVHLRPCTIGGIRASVIRPLVPDYPSDQLELLAPVRLRVVFGFDDGVTVRLAAPDDPWSPNGPPASIDALDAFDAIVFDLDGTLVDLAVDWSAVHDTIEERFEAYLDKPVRAHGQNELFETATEHGVFDDLAGLLETYERDGAEAATPLVGLDALQSLSVPVGICTANARSAAECALDRFGVSDHVDAIIARETVRPGKPDPAPLLECLDRLGVEPGNALFVGDHPSDAETAWRARSSFLHIEQLRPSD